MTKYLSCIALMLCLLVSAANGFADTTLINVYDANGNLISGDGQYYEYNDANQLVRVRQGDRNGTVVAEYFYDSTGQRVKKIENGVVTYYVGKHFEKQVGGTNAGNASYYFAEGGERVAKKDASGNVNYYHLDHLDGVNVVTNASGTEVARSDYLPFGDTRSDSTGTDKYGYTGKEKDKTELYYFEARYNSPANRHFTQADIADPDYDDPQDLNRYAYVGNNPLSYVDEDGFKKKKLSKREKRIAEQKRAAAHAQKQANHKPKLSKREEWMIAHGYDPDKDKTSLKSAKKREKEKQKAAALWAQQHPVSSVQSGAGHSLMGERSNPHSPSAMSSGTDIQPVDMADGDNGTESKLTSDDQCGGSDWTVGDWCGGSNWTKIVPDKSLGIDMRHACYNHDHHYCQKNYNKIKADIQLGMDIIKDNKSYNPVKVYIASAYTWVVILLGGEAYNNAQNSSD